MTMTHEEHLTVDDMPAFTRLRMTAFGEAVIDIANDPAFDEWTFSAKIRHALAQETNARAERRMMKLLKASRTPNLAACVEDIHYLPDRNLTRDVVARLAACRWIDHCSNLVVLGSSSVGKSYLAQALVHAAARHDYTVRYYRLDDVANQFAILHHGDPARMKFREELRNCDLLVLDDFLTTPITEEATAELLNILSAREGRGSTAITSQFDPQDWYKSLHDAVIAESILNRIISGAEILQLAGPNMRRRTRTTPTQGGTDG